MSEGIEIGDYEIFMGFHGALARSKRIAEIPCNKITEAQNQYFRNSPNLPRAYIKQANLLLDEALQKFYFGTFALEGMWGIHNYLLSTDRGLPKTVETKVTSQHNELEFMLSAVFDYALYEWRSFLDFYLKYLLFFCTHKTEEKISTKKFRKAMEREGESENNRAKEVFAYIKSDVLNMTYGGKTKCWGDLLRELRDKTSHQRIIKPTMVRSKNFAGFEIGWPKINNKDIANVAQSFQNEPFLMIQQLFPILYGVNWISGGFQPGMFSDRAS